LAFLLLGVIFVFWYWEGENFSDGAVSGTYMIRSHSDVMVLVLTPDHTFRQQLKNAGTVSRATGTWIVSGEGHIAFSKEFLVLPGEEVSPAGQAYGQIQNWFGFVSIMLEPAPDGPKLIKKVFR
jgi:hypothetical protein